MSETFRLNGAGSDRVTIRPKRKDKLDGWETINSSVSAWVSKRAVLASYSLNFCKLHFWQIWGCYTNSLSGKALVGAYMHMMIYDDASPCWHSWQFKE